MSPKARHTNQSGGEFETHIVPEAWYHVKVGWIGQPEKPVGQYAKGDEVRRLGFDIIGGEYAGVRAFLAFGIPLYAGLDDTSGQKQLNDLGFPLFYRLHPSSTAAKLSNILVGYDPEGKEEGEEVMSIPDAWMGAECEAKITNYTYQTEEGEKTINQVYGVKALRSLQALTASKQAQVLSMIKEAKQLGMEPNEVLVPFLKQQGIPHKASEMESWTETQADMALEFLIDWGEANAIGDTESPDEEVIAKW